MTASPGHGPGVEQCARCGHVAGTTCPTCGASDPMLGGSIWHEVPGGESGTAMNVLRLCHTFVRSGSPTCYTRETHDRTAGTGRWTT